MAHRRRPSAGAVGGRALASAAARHCRGRAAVHDSGRHFIPVCMARRGAQRRPLSRRNRAIPEKRRLFARPAACRGGRLRLGKRPDAALSGGGLVSSLCIQCYAGGGRGPGRRHAAASLQRSQPCGGAMRRHCGFGARLRGHSGRQSRRCRASGRRAHPRRGTGRQRRNRGRARARRGHGAVLALLHGAHVFERSHRHAHGPRAPGHAAGLSLASLARGAGRASFSDQRPHRNPYAHRGRVYPAVAAHAAMERGRIGIPPPGRGPGARRSRPSRSLPAERIAVRL